MCKYQSLGSVFSQASYVTQIFSTIAGLQYEAFVKLDFSVNVKINSNIKTIVKNPIILPWGLWNSCASLRQSIWRKDYQKIIFSIVWSVLKCSSWLTFANDGSCVQRVVKEWNTSLILQAGRKVKVGQPMTADRESQGSKFCGFWIFPFLERILLSWQQMTNIAIGVMRNHCVITILKTPWLLQSAINPSGLGGAICAVICCMSLSYSSRV